MWERITSSSKRNIPSSESVVAEEEASVFLTVLLFPSAMVDELTSLSTAAEEVVVAEVEGDGGPSYTFFPLIADFAFLALLIVTAELVSSFRTTDFTPLEWAPARGMRRERGRLRLPSSFLFDSGVLKSPGTTLLNLSGDIAATNFPGVLALRGGDKSPDAAFSTWMTGEPVASEEERASMMGDKIWDFFLPWDGLEQSSDCVGERQ